jgi:hypothetical protein
MRKAVCFLSLLLPVFYGCEKPVPDMKEFPILRTLSVTDNDSTGVTFTGEFLTDGGSPVTSYGFVWDSENPLIGRSDTVVLGQKYHPGVFKTRIDRSLAAGVDYQVRAYALTADLTVYGDSLSFRSRGSRHGKWSLETSFLSEGISDGFGCTLDNTGYMAFCWSQFYAYNPQESAVKKLNSIPIPTTASTRVLPVTAGKTLYLFTEYSNNLLKYEGGNWIVQSILPFGYWKFGGYYHAMAVSDTIYILSTYVSYMYDIKNNKWTAKEPLLLNMGGSSVMGVSNGRKAYLVTLYGGFFEYDTATDTWTKLPVFPGDVKEEFVSSSLYNKLYFGFSKTKDSNESGRMLWCYDIIQGTWQPGDSFPVVPPLEYDLFGFTIGNKLYIGIGAPYSYWIWKYDPAR